MLYFTFFCCITLMIYGIFTLGDARRKMVQRRLSTFTHQDVTEETEHEEKNEVPLVKRILFPVWREFKKSFKKRLPGEKEAKIEIKLLQAGSPFNMTPVDFRILQLALVILLPVLVWLYATTVGFELGPKLLVIVLFFVIAIVLPNYYLTLKIKQRTKQAVKELPDVLDLLTVSLEAGLGFDAALSKLISKKRGVIPTEFHRCLEEIRLGKTRREALQGVKERLRVDEISTLISSILQAEKLGIGMVQVLRIQSVEARDQRRQRAEEEAMKAPIKMLFPLVLFIFPSLFIVLLGPAIIQFIQTFSK